MRAMVLALLLPCTANAAKTVMEGIRSSNDAVLVSTKTPQLLVNTTAYNGGISNVGVFAASNVVIGANNACVIYSSGSMTCGGTIFAGSSSASTVSTATICGGGGVLVASGTLNNTTQVTVSASGLFISSRTYRLDIVYFLPAAISSLGMWFNNSTLKQYDAEISAFGNGQAYIVNDYDRNGAYAVPLLSFQNSTIDNAGIGASFVNYASCTINSESSTTLSGFCDSRGTAVTGSTYCNNGKKCVNHTSWGAQLAAVPSRLDFCTNAKNVATQVPDCLTAMNAGHWILCGEGWQTNP